MLALLTPVQVFDPEIKGIAFPGFTYAGLLLQIGVIGVVLMAINSRRADECLAGGIRRSIRSADYKIVHSSILLRTLPEVEPVEQSGFFSFCSCYSRPWRWGRQTALAPRRPRVQLSGSAPAFDVNAG